MCAWRRPFHFLHCDSCAAVLLLPAEILRISPLSGLSVLPEATGIESAAVLI